MRKEKSKAWIVFGATLILLFNDHFLKGSGLLPPAWTGKLSDVAGLVVAPWVLARLLIGGPWVRTRRTCELVALVPVVSVFVAINSSQACSDGLRSVFSLIGMSWSLWPDPTDLFALGALPLSWAVLPSLPATEEPSLKTQPRKRRDRLLLLVATGACVASGRPERPSEFGYGFLVNVSDGEVVYRASALSGSIDCDSGPLLQDGVVRAVDFMPPSRAASLQNRDIRHLTPPGAGSCSPVRLSFWLPGQDEEDATDLVVAFSREGRRFFEELQDGDLDDTSHLLVLRRKDDELEVTLGKGLRKLELGEERARSPSSGCELGVRTSLSMSSERVWVQTKEAIGPRCWSYTGTSSPPPGENAGGASGESESPSGSAGSPATELDGLSTIHICSEAEPGLAPGDRAFGRDGEVRYVEWNSGASRHGVFTQPGSRPLDSCDQVRHECGAVWIKGEPMEPPPSSYLGEDVTVEESLTVVLSRPDCPEIFRTNHSTTYLRFNE